MTILGQRIKDSRKKRGLTQDGLALKIKEKMNTETKMNKTTISNYETGYSSPSNELLVVISDVLSVSVDFLLGRSDDPELNAVQYTELRKEFNELIDALEKMPKEKQDMLLEMMKAAVGHNKK
ncbi:MULTISPECIES: helix-turn-helix domain-containing protein [Bacillus cereus group]|uniref:helix-turn-helix domain-containing protein n=1 Tax=Bacillus cereus group TaxID=86661 RepID=UPI000BF73568|nr:MULTISPECIES: helix-turn-helix transcriptional regulator [Bacillus cereus group]MBD8075704.1 helix-turn-helix transcriptional regulator [Bacillus thuringiensis]MCQ6336962.1 helix-turn-helix domain-containing protein [Bacillus cereus]MCU4819114.1 helix-turn-helix domain-containing protein [Bacillus cereus]MED2801545.1 helix-turn-helix transcriptional regulator [Bacillus thuringiensis]PFT03512.1 transcriptional regulator [Bacillus thuringiensis]